MQETALRPSAVEYRGDTPHRVARPCVRDPVVRSQRSNR